MKKTIIVEFDENPTTETYLISFMRYKGINHIKVNHTMFTEYDNVENVFIVRYLSRRVVKWIERIKPKRIFYFMDDDLLDFNYIKVLPLKYSIKLIYRATLYREWIENNTILVVSNERLQEKYEKMKPVLLPPNPAWINGENLKFSERIEPFLVFYHATASHVDEFPWLAKVVKKLQNEDIYFEIVADDRSSRYFSGLKNTWVLRPMRWSSYIRFLSLKYRSLALAINYPNSFNKMRTHVKFFNNLYAGVVGVYNTGFPNSGLISSFNAGIVLPLEHDLWVGTILELKKTPEKLKEMYKNSLELYHELKRQAVKAYDKIEVC